MNNDKLVKGRVYRIQWTDDGHFEADGRRVMGIGDDTGGSIEYYFDDDGRYLGPDDDGTEPIWDDSRDEA
jgi:hypothetical protein